MFSPSFAQHRISTEFNHELLDLVMPATIIVNEDGVVIGSAGRFGELLDWFDFFDESQQTDMMLRLCVWVNENFVQQKAKQTFVFQDSNTENPTFWEFRVELTTNNRGSFFISLMPFVTSQATVDPSSPTLEDKEVDGLREQVKYYSTFAYSSAHDLKAPLHQLEGLLTILEHDYPFLSESSPFTRIVDSVKNLEFKIKGMLEMFKLEQKFTEAPVKKLSLMKCTSFVESNLSSLIEQCKPQIVYTLRKDEIVFNELCLEIVIQNVLSNAIKYSEGINAKISVKSRMVGEYLLLKISDNGMGFDVEKNQDKIAKPFSRFTDKKEGSGVGLYMVKSIMERGGGRMDITSKVGRGTEVSLYFKQALDRKSAPEVLDKVALRMSNINKEVHI